jgi:DTW domain-containing protein YfiP
VQTRTRVVLVRHLLEQAKHSNTGRLIELMVPNHVVLTHGEPGVEMDTSELVEPDTWLLFPEGTPRQEPPRPPPRRLVVLDGTWKQARRMRRRIAALRGVPVLSIRPGAMAARRLRRAPEPGAMATVEAVARALEFLEGEEPARALLEAFDLMVERSSEIGHR